MSAGHDARNVALALGGEVQGDHVLAPGPGHSDADRSLSVKLDPKAPGGFVVHSFAGDDPLECRDHVRSKAGLPEWKPAARVDHVSATYIYEDADGAPYLRVQRTQDKAFWQSHWDGHQWVKGKPPGPKIPYRLPALLDADGGAVYIVEGEKDADRLAALGLVATTNSEGAGKWTADLAKWLRGRTAYVLPDNDPPGRDHAKRVARSLHGVAAEVRIVELPGLRPKGDVSDWLAAGGNVQALDALCSAAPAFDPQAPAEAPGEGRPRQGRVFTADTLAGRPIPPRPWHAKPAIPGRTVTLLNGDGGTGKSTLAAQLAVATVGGFQWLGHDLRRGAVLYLSAEDDSEELHRRLADIATFYGVDFPALSRLALWDMTDGEAVLATADSRSGLLQTTPLWDEVEETVAHLRPALIVIDSLADVYGGDENNRSQVRAFVGLLRKLAVLADGAVLLLGHPSLSGMASGSGSSGSTAWNNSVRSRLYLTKPDVEGANPDARTLTIKKANYAASGSDMRILRQGGAFALAEAAGTSLVSVEMARLRVERAFLTLLDSYEAQGRTVSDRPGSNYAPKVFATDPAAEGATKAGLTATMNRLFQSGEIVVAEIGPQSRRLRKIVRAAPQESAA